eukprot:COSAG01_NODE_6213_length_3791_cov_2.926598_3_plen_229_part_00
MCTTHITMCLCGAPPQPPNHPALAPAACACPRAGRPVADAARAWRGRRAARLEADARRRSEAAEAAATKAATDAVSRVRNEIGWFQTAVNQRLDEQREWFDAAAAAAAAARAGPGSASGGHGGSGVSQHEEEEEEWGAGRAGGGGGVEELQQHVMSLAFKVRQLEEETVSAPDSQRRSSGPETRCHAGACAAALLRVACLLFGCSGADESVCACWRRLCQRWRPARSS